MGDGGADGGTRVARPGDPAAGRVTAVFPRVGRSRRGRRILAVGVPAALICGLGVGIALAVAVVGGGGDGAGSGGIPTVPASNRAAQGASQAASPATRTTVPTVVLPTHTASSPPASPSGVRSATASAGGASASAGSVQVGGLLSCTSGASVEGVWVSAAQGAGFAPWQGIANSSSVKYWYTLPESEPYALHVGCGGTTTTWAVSADTPTVTGTANSFSCDDVSGQAAFGTCVRD